MTTNISASFEVKSWTEEPFDQRDGTPKLTNATVTKLYTGDIDGESTTQWLMAYAEDGSATFIGLERISGTIAGHVGTCIVEHTGKYENGAATAELTLVDGGGSGELTGASGRGDFRADPAGTVYLELDFA